ncbi:adhesion G-protein coupled receptor G2-like isoform X1 [Anneissia japonica]|uniref:adhesion G-protein coupled receptor G2-like isoform X1 n=1 Tax=Anneissia japonica TaxID=1529436 RepID=UPI0014256883|nr:adhesion G-protein coupled receptor G2-like isoform X1 [Anneissia japonica]
MVVENLFSVDENILIQSQMENQAPTRIVEVLEGQLSNVELNDKGIYEEMAPNLAVQAQRFDVNQFSQEDTTYLSYISESDENGVGNIGVLGDREEIPDAANVSIALPVSIFDVVKKNNMTDFRIVVVVYSGSKLFQSALFVNNSLSRRPNSQVISLSVPGLDRVELQEPVVTTFIPLKINDSIINTMCVFWDFELDGAGGWSSEGCTFVNESVDGSNRQYCECSHLTNFAILMDFKRVDPLPPPATIVTTVGLSISIICLCLTILTLVTNRNFRRSEPRKFQCQLCLSLLGLYIVFLAGIDQTDSSEGCIVAGALLHYFLLSSVFWMSVQAVNMYYLFVKVFDAHVLHFFLKGCLFAWGLPVVIVLVSAFIDIDGYIDSKTHCFLTLKRMYYAVAIPVALPLLFNTLIFIMVLHSLSLRGTKTNDSPLKKQKNRNNGVKMLQNGVSITLVLGLTWIIGFFAIGDAAVIMLWLFCILNSFQGFLIFIMYCVRNKDVRTHWCKMLRILP